MIEHMSMEEWIRATDFIGSGTVGTGCGLELDRWIQPGDLLELTIDKIGTLKNIVGTPNTRP
jgi:2-keto-4-pentenoate hydratase/2-oxohepta-3-ene-1,7-dioic acid hydratase in catechol pathway